MRGTGIRQGKPYKRPTMEERKALVRKQRIILGSLGLLLLFYIGGAVRGVFRFEPHSFVNGIEVSGMSLGHQRKP